MRAPALLALYRSEFASYSLAYLRADLVAGLTVAAVALPLALAFGVASGADAAAGLITAIVAGLLIGSLAGGPYQISGPTGAMSAVLIVVAARYGLPGVWTAGAMAGLLILAAGVLRLGRVATFVPPPVIAGFTAGISLIIAIGQLDNILGVHGTGGESVPARLAGYLEGGLAPSPQSLLLALLVVAVMIGLPRLASWAPASLGGIVAATLVAVGLGWDVATIGEIPRGLVPEQRLRLEAFSLPLAQELFLPAVSIAMLGAVESLLCGAVAGTMTGRKMDNDQELVAQGVGNLVLPFLGGVPATAAIARTSVGVKSGGQTRLMSVFHSLALLATAVAAGPLIARIPLAALGGVLVVTAFRMNEWGTIRFLLHKRLWPAVVTMAATMVATVLLDLTQAIVIGIVLSGVIFLRQLSAIVVSSAPVDPERLGENGHRVTDVPADTRVIYVTGPLFFGSVAAFLEALEDVPPSERLVLSMRGVPNVDHMGLEALQEVVERHERGGGEVHLSGVQPAVRALLRQAGVLDHLGPGRLHWSADQAIVAALPPPPAVPQALVPEPVRVPTSAGR